MAMFAVRGAWSQRLRFDLRVAMGPECRFERTCVDDLARIRQSNMSGWVSAMWL